MKVSDIRIRDPFVLTDYKTNTYYLYGTTDDNTWSGKGTGFNAYRSADLREWEGPFSAFRPPEDFWGETNFWAPEVTYYNDHYYMLATFKAEHRCRGTQLLVADHPLGPFKPLTSSPVTPSEWECLDGTLFIDEKNHPWMVFCREWLQVQDGEIYAVRLSQDLKKSMGEPVLLFKASEANWTVPSKGVNYVTDGPFIYRTNDDHLLMLWSSHGRYGYSMGVARSPSGTIVGPWKHDHEMLFKKDGGHGMIFRTFEGRLMLTVHAPNAMPNERAILMEVTEESGKLHLLE
ncbi:glycoside hydrolase family 43 protein [Paenalkalicoccus suaedae]|nr:glycoside hydrolase family 43 protein [Paenalkalicoccus suaedae]